MSENIFIIGPSGDEFSMVSDEFFEALVGKEYSEFTGIEIALDWLLNVKKFCVVEETDGGCMRGLYEATYGIEDYASYATPVTNLGDSYKEPQIGGSDSSTSTEAAGKVMQTSPRNPHRYTLQEDKNNSEDPAPPSELTGEYLGAFFHHRGSWYASFDDIENTAAGATGEINRKEISDNTKKVQKGTVKKEVYVQNKFYPRGEAADIKECVCPCVFISEANGGDEGYSETFQLKRNEISTTLDIYFEAYYVKDGITVTASSGESFSSGCISGSVSKTLELPNGAESITVVVHPNCDGYTTGTAWFFAINCVDNEPP